MAIIVRVNGSTSAPQFLVAPDGTRTFPALVGLRTDDGTTVNATLAVSGSAILSAANASVSPVESFVSIQATSMSAMPNDITLTVTAGAAVVNVPLVAVANPKLKFEGVFQARFATDADNFYNPTGAPDYTEAQALSDIMTFGTPTRGWTWTLLGEPPFAPSVNFVPTDLTMPVGRLLRFNNAIAPRSHSRPVAVSVISVEGTIGTGQVTFTGGDPVIGLPVNLGPDTYLAANSPSSAAMTAEESYGAGQERMACFEFHIGNVFSGKSRLGPYNAALSHPSANPRSPDSRPKSPSLNSFLSGQPIPTATVPAEGIISARAYADNRIDQLKPDLQARITASDFSSDTYKNLITRLSHLFAYASVAKKNDINNLLTGAGQAALANWLGTLLIGYYGYEDYNNGLVDDQLQFNPSGSPVMGFLAGFQSFAFQARFFNFHSDELTGRVKGSLEAVLSDAIPAWQNGIFTLQSQHTASFAALEADDLTPAAVNALLTAPINGNSVVTISPSLRRLVISKVAVDNPAAPTAVTARNETLVGVFMPEASMVPRDLVYMIVPSTHELANLGACEGTLLAPSPAVGFARLFVAPDGGVDKWQFILHAGVNAGAGDTWRGVFQVPGVVKVTACVAEDLELLTANIDFGQVEEGLIYYREIIVLNNGSAPATVTMIPPGAPFGAPAATSLTLPPGELGIFLVSYTAPTGPPYAASSTVVDLMSGAVELNVNLTGTNKAAAIAEVILVLDRSGSMNDPAIQGTIGLKKTNLEKTAAQVLIDLLRTGDRIGIVRFNNTAQNHLAPTTLIAAGDGSPGTGKNVAGTSLSDPQLNPSGSTAIGTAMALADTILAAGSAPTRAMLVLTDGQENVHPYIDEITLTTPGLETYAIGFGTPDTIDTEKLSAITDNTGGYLIITGLFDQEDEYRLQKYFAQILGGISGDAIVLDPRGLIGPGEVQRHAFDLSEAETSFDVVLLTNNSALRFTLEAPDGTVLSPATLGGLNVEFIHGTACNYYRVRSPVFPGQPARGFGTWHIRVEAAGNGKVRLTRAPKEAAVAGRAGAVRLPGLAGGLQRAVFDSSGGAKYSYSVIVRARSSVSVDARIERKGFRPGDPQTLVAYATAFGLPATNFKLTAQLKRPDGVQTLLPLKHVARGRYELPLDDKLIGVYQIVLRSAGKTPGNFKIQREHSLSGVVFTPVPKPQTNPPSDDLKQEIEKLKDLLAQYLQKLLLRPPWWWYPVAIWMMVAIIVLLLILVLK